MARNKINTTIICRVDLSLHMHTDIVNQVKSEYHQSDYINSNPGGYARKLIYQFPLRI